MHPFKWDYIPCIHASFVLKVDSFMHLWFLIFMVFNLSDPLRFLHVLAAQGRMRPMISKTWVTAMAPGS